MSDETAAVPHITASTVGPPKEWVCRHGDEIVARGPVVEHGDGRWEMRDIPPLSVVGVVTFSWDWADD